MRRRTLLVSVPAAFAGCTTGDPVGRQSTSTTRTTTRTDSTTRERFVVENRTDESKQVQAAVLRDGEELLSGCFDVPAHVGLRFDRWFEWGSYVVRARLAGGEWLERAWEPNSCAERMSAPNGDMHGGVVVDGNGLRITWNECDNLHLGTIHMGLDHYEPAGEHRRDCP